MTYGSAVAVREWESEPDAKSWHTQGYAVRIARVRQLRHLCGYVAVPKSHPWWGLRWDSRVTPIAPQRFGVDEGEPDKTSVLGTFIEALRQDEDEANNTSLDTAIEVHGGITYGALADDGEHWELGFDCGHYTDVIPGCFDLSPSYGEMVESGGARYRDMDYVTAEVERLALQLRRVEERGTR